MIVSGAVRPKNSHNFLFLIEFRSLKLCQIKTNVSPIPAILKLISLFFCRILKNLKQDTLLHAFALTVYIQFSFIISVLVINSRAMGPIWTNHGDGHIGINSTRD
jgi:hypothetical protein